MKWESLLFCRNDEHYDVAEFDHKPDRPELEAVRRESKCPECGFPYTDIHDGAEVA